MASRFKTVSPEEVTELKEAAANLNTRKSTIKWLRDFKTKIALKKKLEMILLEQLDKVLERFYASMEPNLSPMILKGNQMVFS